MSQAVWALLLNARMYLGFLQPPSRTALPFSARRLHRLPDGNAGEHSLLDLLTAHSQELWLVSISCLLSSNHFPDLNPFRVRTCTWKSL